MPKIPVIIDTDFGGDPDDIFAAAYALSSPSFEIVAFVTSDEYKKNHRAQVLHRWLTSQNSTIPVIPGVDSGHRDMFLLDHVREKKSSQFSSLTSTVFKNKLRYLQENNGWYISIGGLATPKKLFDLYPDMFPHTSLLIMGGAINYIQKNQAEHNIARDIAAAKFIFKNHKKTVWVMSDHTFHEKIKVDKNTNFYRDIQKLPLEQNFALSLFKENMDQFFKKVYPDSYLHDPLTMGFLLTNAITTKIEHMRMKNNGEFILDPKGIPTKVVQSIQYDSFMDDFKKKFSSFLQNQTQ